MAEASESWDPLAASGTASPEPSRECRKRVRKDLREIMKQPLEGIFVWPDEDNFLRIHALIVGPGDTPYDSGFFYFLLHCPADYPNSPPKVKLMTTGGGQVRFNPNLYASGKVCLSILGTWSGPGWSPAQSLSGVLLSIQSLMNEMPLRNEPGFESRGGRDVEAHNVCVVHETLRVAVCDMVGSETMKGVLPEPVREAMVPMFTSLKEHYLSVCERYEHMDGQTMWAPQSVRLDPSPAFEFHAIADRIRHLAGNV